MNNFCFISFFLIYYYLVHHGLCKSDIPIGYNVTLPIPSDYNMGFIGRAFFMETNQIIIPNFKVALSVEADIVHKKYSCSIQVFLGDFKVWSSGHFSQFYPSSSSEEEEEEEKCIFELTKDGDMQLKGSSTTGQIGWKTGTSRQGVERLMLLWTGNLVLMDAKNRIKWQSFDFPTNVILWGQRLNLSTRLTAFSSNSTMYYYYYSFEIQNNKIALYWNSGNSVKYSYWEWEFRLAKKRNIMYAELGSTGLKFFDENHRKLAQISSRRREPIRFLALRENTGNLGLYRYLPDKRKFEASFQAINATCDLPLACGSYGVCTFHNTCTCIQFSSKDYYNLDPNCDSGLPGGGGFCGNQNLPVEMVDIGGVTSILRGFRSLNVVSKEECSSLCIDDCTCVATLFSNNGSDGIRQEYCFHYGMVRGLKQMEKKKGVGLSYSVKVPKGFGGDSDGKSSPVKRWLLLMGWVVDGLVIVAVLGGFWYYYCFVMRKRRLAGNENTL